MKKKNRLCKKKEGAVNATLAMIAVAVAVVLVFINSRIGLIKEMKTICEDALVSSTLAGAVVNVEEYGKSGSIIIDDYKKCYEYFKSSLDINLKLDDQNNSEYTSFFASPIEVTDFIVYNVNETTGKVQIMEGTGQTLVHTYEQAVGTVSAPDGTRIENTSIYSKIKFDVKFSNSVMIHADKDCCVDVKEN